MMYEEFSKEFIEQQKNKLRKLKTEILSNLNNNYEAIQVAPDQTTEDGDQAQAYLDQNLTFGLKERELLRLREVEAALDRIAQGNYGICEETEEPIGLKRLEKMPWAKLSIEAAEAEERNLGHIKVG